MNARAVTIAAYAVMCAIWGTTWLVIKIGLQYVPPITGAGLRFVIAGLLLYAVAAVRREIPHPRDVPWKLVAVLGVFLFGLNYILTYTAETRLSSGLVSVLFGTLVFFVFAFGQYMIGERTSARTWAGALAGFAGVAVISLAGDMRGSLLYAAAVIAASASSAFANVYAKRHSHHSPFVTLPPSMLLAGTVISAIGFAAEHPALHLMVAPQSIAALLYLAIVGSGIAFFLNIWLLRHLDAGTIGLSAFIIPMIAVVVGIVFGGEHFTLRDLIGAALVIGGMCLALMQSKQETLDASANTAIP